MNEINHSLENVESLVYFLEHLDEFKSVMTEEDYKKFQSMNEVRLRVTEILDKKSKERN